MTAALRFDPIRLPPECEQLRKEVRAFLAEEIGSGTFDPYKPNREDTDVPEFSRKADGGYLINGTKIWTSSAHIADYMIAIFRTSPPTKENRRHGLTQFLVKMKQPGIQVNPIGQITGQYEFNEVVFTDYFVPDDHMLGEIDGPWKQATSELAYYRSGPARSLEP